MSHLRGTRTEILLSISKTESRFTLDLYRDVMMQTSKSPRVTSTCDTTDSIHETHEGRSPIKPSMIHSYDVTRTSVFVREGRSKIPYYGRV